MAHRVSIRRKYRLHSKAKMPTKLKLLLPALSIPMLITLSMKATPVDYY